MWHPRLRPAELQQAKFSSAMLGYATPEVDDFLELLSEQLASVHQTAVRPELWQALSFRGGVAQMLRDVRGSTFRKATFGYAPAQVDELLDRVVADLQRLLRYVDASSGYAGGQRPEGSPGSALLPAADASGQWAAGQWGTGQWAAPAPDGGPWQAASQFTGRLPTVAPPAAPAAVAPALPAPDRPLPPPAASFPDLAVQARYAAEQLRPGSHPKEPSRRLVLVTCMDARLDTYRMFGLDVGQAHVLRNAGGRVTDDVLRSLGVSTAVLGTGEIAVVQHHGCGMIGVTDDELRGRIQQRSGLLLPPTPMHTIRELHGSLYEDVARIVSSPLLAADIPVWGATLDFERGLEGVVCAWTHRLAPATAVVDGTAVSQPLAIA